jgi:outer membrane protein OmpA-like peptidoglycan-associated protein/opacity protein-like surface antigen
MKFFATLILFNLLIFSSNWAQVSQTTGATTDGLELGVHAGHFFSSGNVDFKPGYAVGVHLRKSLDYVFSLRLEAMAGQLKGEDDGNVRNYDTDWFSGSFQLLTTLNNLKWSPNDRKTNIYVLTGLGVNQYSGNYNLGNLAGDIEESTQMHFDAGFGISFKISNKINIGLEHKVMLLMTENADFIDGVPTLTGEQNRLTFRDVPNYTSIRLNFNLGQSKEKTQPLYWLNPMETMVNDLQLLKDTRVTLADDDGDGVINQLDEEEDTPAEANVNAKGIAMDSDADGIADYLDKEPFSPVDMPVDADGVAIRPDVMEEVSKLVEAKLKDYEPVVIVPTTTPKTSGVGYLPFVYFGTNSAVIRNKDYGVLSNIAHVMSANKGLQFVVTGHTDQSGGEVVNVDLSYKRAKNVLDFLVKSGVPRSQLILQYKGKKEPLVAGEASVNRRVGFRLANGDSEMAAPSTQN